MENEKIQGTVPVTPTQKKKVVEIPPTNVNKKITTIFKQTEKGLIGFHPAVRPARGKVIIPDKYSKAAKAMTPGEWEVLIKVSLEKFDICIPIKQHLASSEDLSKLAAKNNTIVKEKRTLIKAKYPFQTKQEQLKDVRPKK